MSGSLLRAGVILLVVSSCSPPTPTVDMLRDGFLNGGYDPFTWNQLIHSGVVQLNKFEKTNGVRRGNSYRLEYVVEFEVLKSFELSSCNNAAPYTLILQGEPLLECYGFFSNGFAVLKNQAGKVLTYPRVSDWEMTDNGWRQTQ